MQVNGNDITLEISASASSATKALDKFVSSLKSAKGVLSGKVNNGFASALDVDASKFERQLNSIDKSIERTQKKIEIFQKAVSTGLVKGDLLGEAKSNIAEHQEILSKLVEQRKELFDKAPTKIRVDSSEVGKATTKVSLLSKALSAVKRIMFYRFIRAALKNIASAFREGIKNIYEYSRAVGTDFHTAMDGLSSDALYLKNSLGAVAAPLITALKPAIDWITDALAGVLDLIAQVFAALSGKTSYSKAIRATTEYGDAVNKAGKALKSFTIGLDELNVIDPTSGGGAASKIPDYTKMFEEATIDSDILDFWGKLKKKIDESGVGKALQKLSDAWKNFTNSPVYEIIKKIIGYVLESGIDAVLGTIADAISTIAALINGDLGNAVDGLKNIIADLTFDPIIGLAGILDTIFGTNMQTAVKNLKEQFKEFSIAKWFEDLGNKLGIGDKLKKIFDDLKDKFTKFIDSIRSGTKDGTTLIGQLVLTFGALAKFIGAAVETIQKCLEDSLGDFELSLPSFLESAFKGLSGVLEIGIGLLTGDSETFVNGLGDLGRSIVTGVASIAINMLNNVISIAERFINNGIKAVNKMLPEGYSVKEVSLPRLSSQLIVDLFDGTGAFGSTPTAAQGGTKYGWNGTYDPNTHTYYYGPNKTYGESGGHYTPGYEPGDLSRYLYNRGDNGENIPVDYRVQKDYSRVSDGNNLALERLMTQQNELLLEILHKDENVYIDGKRVARAVNKQNDNMGAQILRTVS